MRQEDVEERAVRLWRRSVEEKLEELKKEVDLLKDRVDALESRRGPGRPPKVPV